MTNNWTDIGNATLVVAFGANPSENHPACMAHINRAREDLLLTAPASGSVTVAGPSGPVTFSVTPNGKYKVIYDRAGNPYVSEKPKAKLVVIDPRKTRTAAQADHYIRVRPGTNQAFINGVMNYLINATSGQFNQAGFPAVRTAMGDPDLPTLKARLKNYHEQTTTRSYLNDTGAGTSTAITWPKYTDATFKVVSTSPLNVDYARRDVATSGISNLPKSTAAGMPDADALGMEAAGTVYSKLQQHVAAYDLATTADICGCTQDEIKLVGDLLIANSRMASYNGTVTHDPKSPAFRSTTWLYAMGLTQHTTGGQNVKSLAVIQTLLGNMGRCGGGINALRGIHNVQGSTDMGLLYGNIPAYSGNPGVGVGFGAYMDGLFGNRLNVKVKASRTVGVAVDEQVIYTARFGGTGGNSLRVAHVNAGANQTLSVAVSGNDITVNLGTDAGGVVTSTAAQVAAAVNATVAANMLLIATLGGTGASLAVADAMTALAGGSNDYTRAYTFSNGGIQQKGFFNMTKAFFSDTALRTGGTSSAAGTNASAITENQANLDAIYALWPKGNGYNHIKMFREMAAGHITAAVVWGQNPAVTEPNQGKVREGLRALDTLICTDIFETETVACDRKPTGVTFLFPACSHVEEAGSATNSGRVLQWRYEGRKPAGNSKSDIELLLRFAYALDGATPDAFSHIKSVWNAAPLSLGWTNAYDKLFGAQYGWTPGSAFDCETVAVAIHKQMVGSLNNGGTIWIYFDGYEDGAQGARGGGWSSTVVINGVSYPTNGIRAKSRIKVDVGATATDASDPANPARVARKNGNLIYKNWGYSWLVNRRVLYNNNSSTTFDGDVPGDQNDVFVTPENVSKFLTTTFTGVLDYALNYRTVHRLNDTPRKSDGTVPAIHVLPGRFPSHTEPYESPRTDLVATWGKNATTDASMGTFVASTYENLLPAGTNLGAYGDPVADPTKFNLVLTTIRCVEHFQGGPITRNNWWNVEAEPEPWVEINSVDARSAGIKDGDMVRVITRRVTDNAGAFVEPVAYGSGFRARVGVGLQSNQRVGAGVVAIPWHWGEKGLSTGSRANDLTVDAMDANTTIPEYKACLCRIEKM